MTCASLALKESENVNTIVAHIFTISMRKCQLASNLCAFISQRMLLRVFCVYLYLHIHTHMYTLNIHKGVIKFTKGSCLPVLTLKSASGSKLGFI